MLRSELCIFNQSGKKRHHRTICIVSHGQVIQGVLAMLKSGAVDDFHRYAQPNASYSVFELINGRCTALKWGSRRIYVTRIKQSDLPQIPAVHVCCSSSVCRSRRGSCLVAIACSGEYSKAGWNGFHGFSRDGIKDVWKRLLTPGRYQMAGTVYRRCHPHDV